jgi:hypothetical protein
MLPVEKQEAEPPADAASPARTPGGRSDDAHPIRTMAAETAVEIGLEAGRNDTLATIPAIGTG